VPPAVSADPGLSSRSPASSGRARRKARICA